MDISNYQIIAAIITAITVLLIGFYLRYRRRRLEVLGSEGATIIQGVRTIFDRKIEALKAAILTTGIIDIVFLVVIGIAWAINGQNSISFSDIGSLLLFIIGASIIIFLFSFLLNYFFNLGSISANYAPFGFIYADIVKNDYVIINRNGLGGIISIKWRNLVSCERNDKEVFVRFIRRPLWLYKLLKIYKVVLSFKSTDDAISFEQKVMANLNKHIK